MATTPTPMATPAQGEQPPAWWRVDHRVEQRAGFVLSLFERLEREERQPAPMMTLRR